jgi:hypothetical protein
LLGLAWFYSSESGLFNGLRRFQIKNPLPFRVVRESPFIPRRAVSPVFVSGSSALFRESKGWRHFYDRGFRPCETLAAPFPSDLSAASLIAREHGGNLAALGSPGYEPGTEEREKTGRSIRCPARMRPLEKSPIRLEPLASGRAPALHASRVSHDPCLRYLSPSVSRVRGGCGRFPSGAFRRLSSSDGSL